MNTPADLTFDSGQLDWQRISRVHSQVIPKLARVFAIKSQTEKQTLEFTQVDPVERNWTPKTYLPLNLPFLFGQNFNSYFPFVFPFNSIDSSPDMYKPSRNTDSRMSLSNGLDRGILKVASSFKKETLSFPQQIHVKTVVKYLQSMRFRSRLLLAGRSDRL
jgi:hypothetical protein